MKKDFDFEKNYNKLVNIKDEITKNDVDFVKILKLYAESIDIAKNCIEYLEDVKGEFNELKKKADDVEKIEKDESDFIRN